MLPSPSKLAMLDTCFIYALFDSRESLHSEASRKGSLVESLRLGIPWPCLYETVNTRFIKEPARIKNFEQLLKRPGVALIDDVGYRDRAYEMTVDTAIRGRRTISLVDMVLRLMLDDVNVRAGYLFTFNPGDFADVCRRRGIELL